MHSFYAPHPCPANISFIQQYSDMTRRTTLRRDFGKACYPRPTTSDRPYQYTSGSSSSSDSETPLPGQVERKFPDFERGILCGGRVSRTPSVTTTKSSTPAQPVLRRSERKSVPPKRYGFEDLPESKGSGVGKVTKKKAKTAKKGTAAKKTAKTAVIKKVASTPKAVPGKVPAGPPRFRVVCENKYGGMGYYY